MSRVSLADDIRGKRTDGGDGDVVCGLGGESRHGGFQERVRRDSASQAGVARLNTSSGFSRCYLITLIPKTRSDAVRDATDVTGVSAVFVTLKCQMGAPCASRSSQAPIIACAGRPPLPLSARSPEQPRLSSHPHSRLLASRADVRQCTSSSLKSASVRDGFPLS